MSHPTTMLRSRGVRTGAASVALGAIAFGLIAPAAHAERVDLTSEYGYTSTDSNGEKVVNILGGYDKPAGMAGDSSIAFCIEMGTYFPSSTNKVVKQTQTDEYPEIAYVINKWGDDKNSLNQAAVQYLVHANLDVYDPGFTTKYGIGKGQAAPDYTGNKAPGSPEKYQQARQQMLDGVDDEVKALANSYWEEAAANASAQAGYTAMDPSFDRDRINSAVVKDFRVNNGDGKAISPKTQIKVDLENATFEDGSKSKTLTIAQASEGLRINFTAGQADNVVVSYDTTGNMPSNELVIAQMAPHDGGDGYDGTGTYPEGNPLAGDKKTNRTGAPAQTSISAVSSMIDVVGNRAEMPLTKNPDLQTEATDKADGDKNITQVGGTVVDTVKYTGLIPGKKYTMEGELKERIVEGDTVSEGETVATASTTFTADASGDGTVSLEFVLPDSAKGKTLVAFETATSEDGDRIVHANIEDEAQTVYVADLSSQIADDLDGDQYLAQAGGTVTDTVPYSNLKPDAEHRIVTELLDRETGESTGITKESTFTSDPSGSGEVAVQIEIPEGYAGKTLLAVQSIYEGETEMASDRWIADAEDGDEAREAETIYVSDLATTALDAADGDKNLVQSGATVVDTVEYTNLAPGQEYTVSGELMDKETGESTGVTATATFTPESPDGTVDVTFEDLPAELAGKTLVAFETVTVPGAEGEEPTVVAEHRDIEDEAQTTYVADIGTTATDKLDGDKSVQQTGGTVVDSVEYTNLVVGQEYTVEGTLMDKATGEALLDADGNPVTSSTTFTPEESNGTVDLEFALPDDARGKTLVAFERVSNDVGIVAVHEDIEDEDQTVVVVDIGTTATDAEDGDKRVAHDGIINDAVAYENLTPGKGYVVKGELMDQATGEAVIDQATGKPAVAETTFTPEEADGIVNVVFDLGSVPNTTVVVFETLYDADGNIQAEHKDIDDRGQTVVTEDVPPEPPIPGEPGEPGEPGTPGTDGFDGADGADGANAAAADAADAAQADTGAGLARTGVNVGGLALGSGILGALGLALNHLRRRVGMSE